MVDETRMLAGEVARNGQMIGYILKVELVKFLGHGS